MEEIKKLRPLNETEIPVPPFWGRRVLKKIAVEEILPFLNREVLFRIRWQFKKELKPAQVSPFIPENILVRFLKEAEEKNLFQFQAIYGYFPGQSHANELIVFHLKTEEPQVVFQFPCCRPYPFGSLANFFLSYSTGRKDVVAFQLVSSGSRLDEFIKEKWFRGEYFDYFLWYGLGAELTEALAEYVHFKIRQELKLDEGKHFDYASTLKRKYRGRRFSPGYPSFPELETQKKILELLNGGEIEVSLTESCQLIPELATTAIVVHHPEVTKYF